MAKRWQPRACRDFTEAMTPYHRLVQEWTGIIDRAKGLPLGGFPAPRTPTVPEQAPNALFFAPHPDDECITGAVALRAARETGMRVINVAVTQGSKRNRQAARLEELRGACNYLGLGLHTLGERGLERINPKTRANERDYWQGCVAAIKDVLEKYQPALIIFPHERDWNSTHIGTHYLVTDALKNMPASFQCTCIETEFWGAMDDPNLMVEISPEQVGDLMAALTFHVVEVKRNPYHLVLPGWMMDNVRRGSELVGGQGGGAPEFKFAVLNRVTRWQNGAFTRASGGNRTILASESLKTLFS